MTTDLKLYELSEAYRNLSDIMAESDEAEQYAATLESIKDSILVKVANIGKLILSLGHTADAIAAEEKRLAERRQALERKQSWLKDYLKGEMVKAGIEKVQADVTTIAIRKSPPSVVITDLAAVPERFQRIIPERKEPDKRLILKAYQEWNIIPPGVSIETANTWLSIQ